MCFLFSVFSACNTKKAEIVITEPAKDSIQKNIPVFQGTLVYEAEAQADDTNELRLFYDFSPVRVSLYFADDKFRMIESGGLSKGNILLHASEKKVWHLDTIRKIAHSGVYSDLDNASDILKDQMPDHFSPTVEDTHETDTILGFVCKKLEVVRSGFVRSDSKTFLWVTDAFQLPHARYDIQTDINKVTAPVPVSIGYKEGTVLKMQIDDKGLIVTYTATKTDTATLASSFFEIPSGYTIQ